MAPTSIITAKRAKVEDAFMLEGVARWISLLELGDVLMLD